MSYVSEFNLLRMETSSTTAAESTITSTLKAIYQARGLFFSVIVFLLCGANTAFNIISNTWLSFWSDDKILSNLTLGHFENKKNALEVQNKLNQHYLCMYGVSGFLQVIFAFAYNVADAVSYFYIFFVDFYNIFLVLHLFTSVKLTQPFCSAVLLAILALLCQFRAADYELHISSF